MAIPVPTDFWRLALSGTDFGAVPANNLTATGGGVTYGPGYAHLDGTDTFASAGGVAQPAGDFTITGWVRFDGTGLATLWGTDVDSGWGGFFLYSTTTQLVNYSYDGTAFRFTAKSYSQAANTWYFVALTYTASTKGVTVDVNNSGSPGTSTLPGPLTWLGAGPFKVGFSEFGAGNLTGRVKLLGLWDGTILSAGELTILYNGGAGFDPTTRANPLTGLLNTSGSLGRVRQLVGV